jgi:hypothetical protein
MSMAMAGCYRRWWIATGGKRKGRSDFRFRFFQLPAKPGKPAHGVGSGVGIGIGIV